MLDKFNARTGQMDYYAEIAKKTNYIMKVDSPKNIIEVDS